MCGAAWGVDLPPIHEGRARPFPLMLHSAPVTLWAWLVGGFVLFVLAWIAFVYYLAHAHTQEEIDEILQHAADWRRLGHD